MTEDNYSSNEEMLAKLQGGASGYAMVVPSDYTIRIMRQENLLAALDHEHIPNLSNLYERFRNAPYDPGNVYCVPYSWGSTGIGYDAAEVEQPSSWGVILDPDPDAVTYGRVSMLDDAREAFAAALLYLGYDINATDEAQLQQAKDVLIRAKAGLSGYDSDTFENQIVAGENLMAQAWNGDMEMVKAEKDSIDFTIPQEGGVIWTDNICIPASATPSQKLAAEMFIDFFLRPEIGAKVVEWTHYAGGNEAAEAFIDPDILSNPSIYLPDDVMSRLHFIEPVGEAESLYQRLWDEVKAAP